MGDHSGFLTDAARVINGRQSNVVVLAGNVGDVFTGTGSENYLPLPHLLADSWSVPSRMVVVLELNGPIRFASDEDQEELRKGWIRWRCDLREDPDIVRLTGSPRVIADIDAQGQAFDQSLLRATGNSTLALELLRQWCLCSREALERDLIVIIEAADLLIPDAELARQQEADRHRLHICLDWFSDPEFSQASDAVVLIAEAMGALHHRLRALPLLAVVDVPHPGLDDRAQFIAHELQQTKDADAAIWTDTAKSSLAQSTAGLSLLALRQLLRAALYHGSVPDGQAVSRAVEHHIQTRLGDDVVEFARPEHRMSDVIGFDSLKQFLLDEVVPRFRAGGKVALSGAAVAGPIGAGKTFLFEAFAAELELPVLVLKNIRSQWFGGTDVIIESLRMVLQALERVVILVDEADTAFGSLSATAHATERRLVGKIQGMMSDPRLRGKVFWLLMTARVHRLSPDIRRPGRVGDLIIPVLDPLEDDRRAFMQWMLKPADLPDTADLVDDLMAEAQPQSAAEFAVLRSEISAHRQFSGNALTVEQVRTILADRLTPDIAAVREYQALQAKINCTRRQLLPDPSVSAEEREGWHHQIRALEAQGIS